MDDQPQKESSLSYRSLPLPVVLGVFAAIVLWLLSKVLLAIFASIVIAIGLTGLSKPLATYAKLPPVLATLIVTALVLALIGWPLSQFGAHLWAQFDEIATDVPAALASIKDHLETHASVRFLEEIFLGFDFSKMAAPVAGHLTTLFSSVGTALSYLIVLLFGAIYLALDPWRYINGAIYFTPVQYRGRIKQFLSRSGSSLRIWLFTQLLVVLMNGVFIGLGLWAFGVQGAAALAMLGGALSFIPYVGTIVAMVIGALATLPQGIDQALYALIVLGAASFFEGYFITPQIQSRTLSLPPVTLIFAILAFTVLFGVLGIILAAPLTIVSLIAIEVFYEPSKA